MALLEGWESGDLEVSEVLFGSVGTGTAGGTLKVDEFLSRRGGGRLHRGEMAGELLKEGFEFEQLLGWQQHARNGASAAVTPALLPGENALEVALSGAGQRAYLERALRYPEGHLLASFLIDPQTLTVPTGSNVQILSALGRDSGMELLGLYLQQTREGLEVRAQAQGGGNNFKQLPLPASPARIEVEWRAATSATAADGGLVLRVIDEAADGSRRSVLESLATGGEVVGAVRVGTSRNSRPGVSGTYYLDDLEIWR